MQKQTKEGFLMHREMRNVGLNPEDVNPWVGGPEKVILRFAPL